MSESHVLQTLVRIVVEDAEAACRRVEDQATNQARQVLLEAQERVDELTRAARELGRTRGRAAEAAEAEAGRREIGLVEAGALDALFERFTRRVLVGLNELPKSERYASALRAWAGRTPAHVDAPAEVFTSKRDRRTVYEALLAAGLADFHVRVDHRVHVGFVVRDLEGRTLHDCRPEALVREHTTELRALLEGAVPAPPTLAGDSAPQGAKEQPASHPGAGSTSV